MNIWELKVQRLKRNIEETREKLNVLMDQKCTRYKRGDFGYKPEIGYTDKGLLL